ncbi:MAG: hypothetical protein NVS4B2_27780 [Chloroflexota bacterium]
MIVGSWERERTTTIATELGCHPQTVREWIARFNAEGVDGRGDLPSAGKKPRLIEEERGRIITLARSDPPGKLVRMGDNLQTVEPEREPQWSLDALASAAHEKGIQVERSQIRRILRRKEFAGGTPGAGRRARIRSLSQKGTDRQPLHGATGGSDDPLPR